MIAKVMEIRWSEELKCWNLTWYMNMVIIQYECFTVPWNQHSTFCIGFMLKFFKLYSSFPATNQSYQFFSAPSFCVYCLLSWRMEQISQWLWKQEYWLPPGIGWEDMEKMEGSRRPLPRDLLLALPLALGFIMLRYAFERWLMTWSSPEGFKCNLSGFDTNSFSEYYLE